MSQISENGNGVFIKTYSNVELSIIRSLQNETKTRSEGDNKLWAMISEVDNRTKAVERQNFDLTQLQNTVVSVNKEAQNHEHRIVDLEKNGIKNVYSKEEMDSYLIGWRVEEISHVFDTPTNKIFDSQGTQDIKVGYMNFPELNINEPHDYHFPENTMRRYSINAYCGTPTSVVFKIRYADRCTVYIDELQVAAYVDTDGNFNSSTKTLVVDLKEGWTKIQFLVANRTQRGGLQFTTDLFEKADYLSNLLTVSGLVSSDDIQPGAIEGKHVSPDMDMVVRTIRTTLTGNPSVIVGSADKDGVMRIADGLISKSKNEPFEFKDSIRVHGTIYGERVRLDEPAVTVVSESEPELVSRLTRDDVVGDIYHLKLDLSDYVTRKDFDDLKKIVMDIKDIIELLRSKPIITYFDVVEIHIEDPPKINKFQVSGMGGSQAPFITKLNFSIGN